jgi:prepilin-type N-terminal cleavage/methylation domain-containing protein
MVSLKNKSKGFTIVELLIVIVVIGILATLVIVTFTGIQQKARNSQRQTDINAVDSHVEAFYAQYGFYPTLADLESQTATTGFVPVFLKGLDPEALRDPKQATGATIGATVGAAQYSYVAEGTGCTNTTATTITGGSPVDNGCTSFTLTAQQEGGGNYVKKSN